MTNIVKQIEDRLSENKSSVKTYASSQFAEAKGENLGKEWNEFQGTNTPLEYIIVYLPRHKRWTVVFNLTKHLQATNTGGYIFWIAEKGFFTI